MSVGYVRGSVIKMEDPHTHVIRTFKVVDFREDGTAVVEQLCGPAVK
jgi:hypothetical protein